MNDYVDNAPRPEKKTARRAKARVEAGKNSRPRKPRQQALDQYGESKKQSTVKDALNMESLAAESDAWMQQHMDDGALRPPKREWTPIQDTEPPATDDEQRVHPQENFASKISAFAYQATAAATEPTTALNGAQTTTLTIDTPTAPVAAPAAEFITVPTTAPSAPPITASTTAAANSRKRRASPTAGGARKKKTMTMTDHALANAGAGATATTKPRSLLSSEAFDERLQRQEFTYGTSSQIRNDSTQEIQAFNSAIAESMADVQPQQQNSMSSLPFRGPTCPENSPKHWLMSSRFSVWPGTRRLKNHRTGLCAG